MLNQQNLKELFDYKDGNLYWKVNRHRVKCGDIAGTLNRKYGNTTDYWQICLNGKKYKAHTLIWIYHYGEIPKMIDHIDRNGLNNKIENLRIATPSQNSFNQKIRPGSKSGVKGVSWNKKLQKWKVEIRAFNKPVYLGVYSDKQEAINVANNGRLKLHGEFTNF